jgi:hypothetical protein
MIDNCLRQGDLNTSNTSRQTKSGAEANRNRSTTHYGRVNRSVQIVGVLKRLDRLLSDAVYLHGSYLTGQKKIVRHHPQDEGRAHSQESSNASGIHVSGQLQIDGRPLLIVSASPLRDGRDVISQDTSWISCPRFRPVAPAFNQGASLDGFPRSRHDRLTQFICAIYFYEPFLYAPFLYAPFLYAPFLYAPFMNRENNTY